MKDNLFSGVLQAVKQVNRCYYTKSIVFYMLISGELMGRLNIDDHQRFLHLGPHLYFDRFFNS
jgi:hypothetical protein